MSFVASLPSHREVTQLMFYIACLANSSAGPGSYRSVAPISSGAVWDVDPYNWRTAGVFGKTISWGLAGARPPHNMDDPPTRWPQSPRVVVQCAPSAPNGQNHLGFCVLQAGSASWPIRVWWPSSSSRWPRPSR